MKCCLSSKMFGEQCVNRGAEEVAETDEGSSSMWPYCTSPKGLALSNSVKSWYPGPYPETFFGGGLAGPTAAMLRIYIGLFFAYEPYEFRIYMISYKRYFKITLFCSIKLPPKFNFW